jgi:hypothetical protein
MDFILVRKNNTVSVSDGKIPTQPGCQGEWKKYEEENE